MTNAFITVFNRRLATTRRPFLARGSAIKRCGHCMIAKTHCICQWLKPFSGGHLSSDTMAVDLVLLMHSDEILKPTNTGRLAADAFPNNCWVFEWSRLEPSKELIALLEDPARQCVVVYPSTLMRPEYELVAPIEVPAKRLTIILLDGTWRQAARMINHSQWLAHVPSLVLDITAIEKGSNYAMRKATQATRLSTAEAAAIALDQVGQKKASHHLLQLFTIFNAHYHATRACIKPELTDAHSYLESLTVY
ncbi:MAG: DTW domain-containing protein [Marinagarivorans sp.]|nr:DTW domain-containing protein [Marinagarivorans sp.]